MKIGDIIWAATLCAVLFFALSPYTNETFLTLTKTHPYISGFVKFGLLASMGELLVVRIMTKSYTAPKGFIAKIIIWGFIGVLITLMFNVFAVGVKGALAKGLLPGGDSKYAFAIFVSVIMNCIFAPTFMAFHRYTDTYIDLYSDGKRGIKTTDVTSIIDWNGFVSFVLVKTVPFFWIPAHFITFMLPASYRVLMAALLSIALGAILSFAKRKK